MSDGTIKSVVEGGFCVGCGACAVATNNRIPINTDLHGWYVADLSSANQLDLELGSRVCPFSDAAISENELAEEFLPKDLDKHDGRLGRYSTLLAGRITDDEKVQSSSSGGLTTWVLEELLKRGDIDGVIHVAPSESPLFVFVESNTVEELRERGKSRYFAVEFSAVIEKIRGNGKRYAFVGVPCFIKAIRLLCREDLILADQVRFCIGLICGHIKSFRYAELMAWQQGVPPGKLRAVDFRLKQPARASNSYDVGSWGADSNVPRVCESTDIYGNNWGYAFMQLQACDYCDDVMAEAADITFGDAWLPQYRNIWQGMNVVISRSLYLDSLIREGASVGQLKIEALTPDETAETQEGNYRHRWDGLSVRLADAVRSGRWVPRKRIAPGSRPVVAWRRKLIRLRVQSEKASHVAFQQARETGDLDRFMIPMKIITNRIDQQYKLGKLLDGTYF